MHVSLNSVRSNLNIGCYFNSYKERAVEWKACEIHGGPAKYWKFLKAESKCQGAPPSNLLPYDYSQRRKYDLNLPYPPLPPDRYVGDSSRLHHAKACLDPWVWDTCNAVLNDVFLGGRFPIPPDDLNEDRRTAMKQAVLFVKSQSPIHTRRVKKPLGRYPSIVLL
ncbi:hypothetical protein BD310DRAFT_724526 [Dichomitus squalens]|uniref:Uncharacterized protein n=1 Tax=Dichomitus squalens TaxID=114155 RepID=A0A4Q9PL00_9APHY|nr:hypothetical protein BD310DRAFT_724526 [Dichomitus squalens]